MKHGCMPVVLSSEQLHDSRLKAPEGCCEFI